MHRDAEVARVPGQMIRDDGRLAVQREPALLGERLPRTPSLLGRLSLNADSEVDRVPKQATRVDREKSRMPSVPSTRSR